MELKTCLTPISFADNSTMEFCVQHRNPDIFIGIENTDTSCPIAMPDFPKFFVRSERLLQVFQALS